MVGKNYVDVITKYYADFGGRAGQSEFWLFYLVHYVIIAIIAIVGAQIPHPKSGPLGFIPLGIFIPYAIYSLATTLPSLAVTIRQLHDAGYSGWFFFVSFFPFVGGIILTVLLVLKSDPHDNIYGPTFPARDPLRL